MVGSGGKGRQQHTADQAISLRGKARSRASDAVDEHRRREHPRGGDPIDETLQADYRSGWRTWFEIPNHGERDLARSIELAFDLLEMLARSGGKPVPQGELTTALGAAKSSVSETVSFLRRRGYLQRADAGGLEIASQVLTLSAAYLAGKDIVRVSKPILVELVSQVNESATLSVMDRGALLVVAHETCAHPLAHTMTIGARAHLHSTASGKILLAFDPERDRIVADLDMVPVTDATIVDRAELALELPKVAELGVAYSDNEAIDGVFATSVPVRIGGKVVAALSVAAPQARISPKRIASIEVALRAATKRIGAAFGG